MDKAIDSGAAIWTHRTLAAIARSTRDSRSEHHDGTMDVAYLARTLAQAPWWDGCPTAAEAAGGDGNPGYRRISLREPSVVDDYSVLLIVWPSGHVTPIHDHDGLWGLELVLDGVLQVESFAMTLTPTLHLAAGEVTPLGIGDHAAFSDIDYAHRCRNLSAQRPALSLHVYGGALKRYCAYDHDARGRWDSVPQRAALELANH